MKLLCTICLLLVLSNQNNAQTQIDQKIDEIIKRSMQQYQIPGMSLAVIKGDRIIQKKNYGFANLEHSVPISDESIFRVYSITKIFISTLVFKYIEEGKLGLEDELKKFNLKLPDEWKNRKVKHLLSYSTGFPDMAPVPDYQDLSEDEAWQKVTSQSLSANAGEQYDYNQTNFYILQKIIEKISKRPISEVLIEHQFFNSEENSFMSSDSRVIVKNRVTPYFPFETGSRIITHPYLQGEYFAACNGMNISMDEFIKWDQSFRNNLFLRKETKSEMLELFEYNNSLKKFTYGWDRRDLNEHTSFGFSGSLVTAYRIFPNDSISIILLGNGMGKYFDIENIVNDIANVINPDILNLEKIITDRLLELMNNSDFENYKEAFVNAAKDKRYDDFLLEGLGNSIGYHLLRRKLKEDAIKVFILNTELFPLSWNVHDSLGEAYSISGNTELAIKNYKHSLLLNPNNENGKKALEKLEGN